MRMARVSALFLFFMTLCSIGTTTPARASFGDCNSPAYLALFDDRFDDASDFLCVESDRVAVTSDAGVTHIRIAQHLVADWATRPGAVRSIKDGVDGAVRAMARLGRFRIPDVTILLVDSFSPGAESESFGEIAAWTGASADECRITVWLLGSGATASNGASMIAHELFHCIQFATLSAEQLRAGSADWWIEGAADWFSTAAVPPAPYMGDRVTAFDANSATTALTSMTYDGYVFFAWLGGARGHESVVPFLRQMASSPGVGAQRAAMASALPADQWLRFGEDYMDRAIHDGQGASINSTPVEGEALEWSDTRTERVNLAPFTIVRRNLSFNCGRWTIAPRPARFHAAKPSDGAWGDLPGDLDNLGNTHGDFRFVGVNASADAVPLQLAVTLAARCAECAGVREVDSCMIGAWQMTTNGAEQWMRENVPNFRITEMSASGNTMTLNSDGTFSMGRAHVRAAGELDEASGTGRVDGEATGRWSTAGGQLNLCTDSASGGGEVTVTIHGRTIRTPMNTAPPPVASNAYSCAGSTFTHTIPIPGHGAAVSTYNRTR